MIQVRIFSKTELELCSKVRFFPLALAVGRALWLHAPRPPAWPFILTLSTPNPSVPFQFLFFYNPILQALPLFSCFDMFSRENSLEFWKNFGVCLIRGFTEYDSIWLDSTKLLNLGKECREEMSASGSPFIYSFRCSWLQQQYMWTIQKKNKTTEKQTQPQPHPTDR